MSKKSGGRPSSYKPEYCKLLIEHFKTGKSYAAFAALIGVHRDTLHEWERVHQEYSDSKKHGWEHYQAWWEQQGLDGLYDQTFRETDGSTRTVKLNATVWIYNMKCRFRKDWFDQKDIALKEKPAENDKEEIERLKTWYKNLKEIK